MSAPAGARRAAQNRSAAARYREAQRAMGRRGRLYYLTDEEEALVRAFVAALRGGGKIETHQENPCPGP